MNLVFRQADCDYSRTSPVYFFYTEGAGRDRMAIGKAYDVWREGHWIFVGELFMNIETYFTEEQAEWIRAEFPKRITMINVTHRLTK